MFNIVHHLPRKKRATQNTAFRKRFKRWCQCLWILLTPVECCVRHCRVQWAFFICKGRANMCEVEFCTMISMITFSNALSIAKGSWPNGAGSLSYLEPGAAFLGPNAQMSVPCDSCSAEKACQTNQQTSDNIQQTIISLGRPTAWVFWIWCWFVGLFALFGPGKLDHAQLSTVFSQWTCPYNGHSACRARRNRHRTSASHVTRSIPKSDLVDFSLPGRKSRDVLKRRTLRSLMEPHNIRSVRAFFATWRLLCY